MVLTIFTDTNADDVSDTTTTTTTTTIITTTTTTTTPDKSENYEIFCLPQQQR